MRPSAWLQEGREAMQKLVGLQKYSTSFLR